MQTSNRFTGNLANYQDILGIGYHIFENAQIRIIGTKEDPLFNCLDVVKILGSKKANHNDFYRNNKNNDMFVRIQEVTRNTHPTKQDPIKGNHTKPLKFFTETGLYECIFANDSNIAKQFRRDIIQTLKNYRLGVLSIHVERMDLLNKQLAEQKLQTDNIIQELVQCRSKLAKAEHDVFIYEYEDQFGRKYRGRSTNPTRRDRQHKNNSCNKGLREAMSVGGCNMRIIDRVKCLSDDDAKYAEAKAILAIPKEHRLNITIPKPDLSRVTITDSELLQEEIKEMSVIDERITEFTCDQQNLLDQKPLLLVNAIDQLKRLVQYLQKHNGVYPKKRSEDNEEHEMAILVARIRKEMKGQLTTAITKDRLAFVKQHIPDFRLDGVDIKFQNSVQKLKKFYAEHKHVPHYSGSISGEKTVYGIMQRIRQAYQQKDQDYLSEDRIEYVRTELPFLELGSNKLAEFEANVKLLKDFHDKYQRLPLRRESTEEHLHTLYYTIKDSVNQRDKFYEQKRAIILSVYPQMIERD